MKYFSPLLFFVLLLVSLTSCATKNVQQQSQPQIPDITAEEPPAAVPENIPAGDANILIAYFSMPEDLDTVDAVAGASIVVENGEKLGNIEYAAKLIQQTTGGDLFRIETVNDYPLDHNTLVDQAAEEQDENARPELKAQVENPEQYDVILLGYPNWWSDMPMPVYTFLESYDFGGKTIIPFIIHGGSGASRTISTIGELQPDAQIWEDALVISRNAAASSAEDVTAWAAGLGFHKT